MCSTTITCWNVIVGNFSAWLGNAFNAYKFVATNSVANWWKTFKQEIKLKNQGAMYKFITAHAYDISTRKAFRILATWKDYVWIDDAFGKAVENKAMKEKQI